MSVVLSAAVRQNLLSLQSTAAQLATTQNDLSTGKKVNSALDNPTNFFTASGLDNRAGDISNLLDGISNGVQVLQAANTGITSVESLVSQAKSIASQALQAPLGYSQKASVTSAVIPGATADNLAGGGSTTGGTFTGGQIGEYPTSNPATLNTFLSDVFSIANNSGANPNPGDYLLIDGKTIGFSAGSGTTISASGANLDLSSAKISDLIGAINTVAGSSVASFSNGAISIGSGTSNSGLVVQGRYSFLSVFSLLSGTSSNLSPPVTGIPDDTPPHTSTTLLGTGASLGALGQTLSFGAVGNGTATTITFGDGTNGTVKTLDQLNSRLAADNLAATLDSTGKLTITTTNDAASATIPALGGTAFSSASGAFYNKTASAPVADPTSQATRSTLVAQYNAILTQIDNTAADSSYNGVNLLSGDQLQLTFDETGKSKLSITGVNDSSAGLGLTALVSGTDFIDNNATNTVLTTLNSVSTKLRSQASAFGSNLSVVQTRQDFNTNLINVLQTGSANLTQADINLEAANSQALSTRQSLSVSALSLANQSQQSVLQLLR